MSNSPIKRAGLLLCLIGPSGGGKTTYVMRLLEDERESIKLSISLTTRPARDGERDGQHYFFVPREKFMEHVERGELFEWEEVHGNCYGTLRSALEESVRGAYDLLLDVDIRGALSFKRAFPRNTIVIFLAPPSPELLLERIRGRGEMSEAELERRLATADREYKQLLELRAAQDAVDYFIINDDRQETYSRVRAVLTAERLRLSRLDAAAVAEICRIH